MVSLNENKQLKTFSYFFPSQLYVASIPLSFICCCIFLEGSPLPSLTKVLFQRYRFLKVISDLAWNYIK